MFFHFILGLLTLTFAFAILIKLVLALFAVVLVLGGMAYGEPFTTPRLLFFTQIVLSAIYGAFIGVVAFLYASRPQVEHSWLYATTGFLAAYFFLGSDAGEKQKQANDLVSLPTERDVATAKGASSGVVVGLIAFPVFYNWPFLFTFVPGFVDFLHWTVRLSDWLLGFWLARAVLALCLLGYILSFGLMALVGGTMALYCVTMALYGVWKRVRS